MTVYLDSEFRCHLVNSGAMMEAETDFFDGKCHTYIEGFRFVPSGESWIRNDGKVFRGEMITAAENFPALEKAQIQYESDESARLGELGIPQESDFVATRNYPVGSFVGIYGHIYEVIRAIPVHSSIQNRQNVIKTTVEHYLDTIKEE